MGKGRDAEDESERSSKQALHDWFVSFPNHFKLLRGGGTVQKLLFLFLFL